MQTVPRQNFRTQTQNSYRRPPRPKVGAHAATQRAFLASRLERHYRLETDGRKWRLKAKRRRALALYLVGFPSFYQSLETIVRRLNESLVGNFHWSRPTVCRTLRDLSRLGLVTPSGYMAMRGTRLRVCHPEALRRESDTPAPANLTPYKTVLKAENNKPRYIDTRVRPKTAEPRAALVTSKPVRPESTAKPEPKPFELAIVEVLDSFTLKYGVEMASALMHWIMVRTNRRQIAPRIEHIKAYCFKAAESFYDQHPNDVLPDLLGDGDCKFPVVSWLIEKYDIEQATDGVGLSRIKFCAVHQKWTSRRYPCAWCRREAA